MKKIKTGFTLAEVLITLGIVGVIAALTVPTIISSFQKNKVGPTLRKFVNTMETANQHILNDTESDILSGAVGQSEDEYFSSAEKFISGTKKEEALKNDVIKTYSGSSAGFSGYIAYDLNTGDAFCIKVNASDVLKSSADTAEGSYKGEWGTIFYDINGFENEPNKLGKDIFRFLIDDNGSIIPYGGNLQYKAYPSEETTELWETNADNYCNKNSVKSGSACSGSIADNDWKVIYKY